VHFLCDILWPEGQSHSDDSHMHANGPRSACSVAQARLTVSYIHLVYMLRTDCKPDWLINGPPVCNPV